MILYFDCLLVQSFPMMVLIKNANAVVVIFKFCNQEMCVIISSIMPDINVFCSVNLAKIAS